MNNAVEETDMGTHASDDDKSAAESKISRRPHPVSRFEVLLTMHITHCVSKKFTVMTFMITM